MEVKISVIFKSKCQTTTIVNQDEDFLVVSHIMSEVISPFFLRKLGLTSRRLRNANYDEKKYVNFFYSNKPNKVCNGVKCFLVCEVTNCHSEESITDQPHSRLACDPHPSFVLKSPLFTQIN